MTEQIIGEVKTLKDKWALVPAFLQVIIQFTVFMHFLNDNFMNLDILFYLCCGQQHEVQQVQ